MGRLKYVLDEAGNPREATLDEYCAQLEKVHKDFNASGWRVAYDQISNGVKVSTVFLGLDHNFDQHGPPLLFEAMVFGGPMHGDCARFATRAEALAGHAKMCEEVRAGK